MDEAAMPRDAAIGRRLKLRDLHILMAVVQAGSMGKAAERLNVSQPAVSRAIADLERAVGVRLLDRSRRGIEPTPYGRALVKRGLAVFDELGQGLKDIEFLADPSVGEVRIGSSDFVAAGTVSVIIDKLSQQYPRIAFHVVSADAATLRRELGERKIELFVGRLYGAATDEEISVDVLDDDPFVVVADLQNPLARRRKIELAELVNAGWVLPPADTPAGSFVLGVFQSSGLGSPKTVVSTYSLLLRQCLVATGRFITVLPRSTLRAIGKRLSLKALPVQLPTQRSQVAIVTLKNRTLSPLARLFIDCAHKVANGSGYRAADDQISSI